jgi:hypothetical protein
MRAADVALGRLLQPRELAQMEDWVPARSRRRGWRPGDVEAASTPGRGGAPPLAARRQLALHHLANQPVVLDLQAATLPVLDAALALLAAAVAARFAADHGAVAAPLTGWWVGVRRNAGESARRSLLAGFARPTGIAAFPTVLAGVEVHAPAAADSPVEEHVAAAVVAALLARKGVAAAARLGGARRLHTWAAHPRILRQTGAVGACFMGVGAAVLLADAATATRLLARAAAVPSDADPAAGGHVVGTLASASARIAGHHIWAGGHTFPAAAVGAVRARVGSSAMAPLGGPLWFLVPLGLGGRGQEGEKAAGKGGKDTPARAAP